MARVQRHKHHSRKSRSCWAVMGAFVASTTLAPRLAGAQDTELGRRLEPLRIAVPGDTRWLRAATQAPPDNARQVRFDIQPGPLRTVIAEIQRVSGATIIFTNDAIGDISSPGVFGVFTPAQAVARAIESTSVTSRETAPNTISLEIRLASEAVDVTGVIAQPRASSPKYTQPLIEVPQTIEVIPRAVMEAQGVTTLSDALRNVPGISMQAGEGGGASSTSGDMFNLRGFSAANSLFVDGVRDDGLISRDVYNLEQVEVFMGPTGSDVGRGNAAGYVNMQTKTPLAASAYTASYAYGTGGQNRVVVDLNQALPASDRDSWLGKSAVRLNALVEDGGVAGREHVDRENYSFAPAIGLGIGTETRLTVSAQITRQDNVPDYGIPGSAWSENQLAPTTVLADREVEQSNFYGTPAFDSDEVTQDSYTGRIEHDLNSNLTLRNQTRYNKTHREAFISAVQSPTSFVPATQTVTIARQGNERENSIVSNQTSVLGRFNTGRARHAASAGVEFSSEEQFAPTLTGLGTRNPTSIYDPNVNEPVTGFNPVHTGASNTGKTSTVGLYAFDTIELGERWQINGGFRLEAYETTVKAVDAAGAITTDLTAEDSVVSGKAGVLYRLTDSANVYLSYGTTITPPGTANFSLSAQSTNQNNPNVDPQKSTNLELGSKVGVFDNRLSLSGALFRTENTNVIFVVDAAAIPPVYNQDDGQRVTGFSLGALGQISPRWQMLASLGYLKTRQISQNATTNGRRLTLTPEFSGSVWTTYDFARGLTLGGGVRYMDEVFVNAAGTIRVPSYALADVMAEYDVNSNLSLRLNVYNLTDAVYIRSINNNGGRYNPGIPRSIRLTTQVRF